jgi:hypothetical protein
MAWTETCKIDFNKQVEHKRAEGMSVRQALKVLSEESGIAIGTLDNWMYERCMKCNVTVDSEGIITTKVD